jgi:hypothetical protein
MHFRDFERPIDSRTLVLRQKTTYQLAEEWFDLNIRLEKWGFAHQLLGVVGGLGRASVRRRVAELEVRESEVWGEILNNRFSSLLLDVCVTARPASPPIQLEEDMVRVVINCRQNGVTRDGCLPEIMWKTASEHYGLDGIAHLNLRRKFHLRALLDEVDASDDRAAVRFFAFGTTEELAEQEQVGGTSLRDLYPTYKASLHAGYTSFAQKLYELRCKLEKMTLGAIREPDVPSVVAAMRLIGTCLGGRKP